MRILKILVLVPALAMGAGAEEGLTLESVYIEAETLPLQELFDKAGVAASVRGTVSYIVSDVDGIGISFSDWK
jgi:hypothetical protein